MSIEDVNCALCGQCITHCPVGALRERDDLNELVYAIADKKKVVVAQIRTGSPCSLGRTVWLKTGRCYGQTVSGGPSKNRDRLCI